MNNMENHVTNLKISKKLKKLGVKQESCFYWFQHCSKVHQGYENTNPIYIWKLQPYFKGLNIDCACSAFLVSELGKMLPLKIKSYRYYNEFEWRCVDEDKTRNANTQIDTISEANVRGKMLIALIEKGLFKNND